jgi:NADH-quinone oxidoreductase subunit C
MTTTEINNAYVLEKLSAQFPEKILSQEEPYGLLSINVPRENAIEIMEWLKEDAELQFIFLTDLCGVHFPEQSGQELGVIYHLHSFIHNIRLRLRTFFPANDPVVPTATTVFKGANWMERETFDFFGIQFSGHPDLRRILNVDDMTYHPLLKQYPLEDATRTDKDDKYFGR